MQRHLTDLACAGSVAAIIAAVWLDGIGSVVLFVTAGGLWAGALYREQRREDAGPDDRSAADSARGDLRLLRANLEQVRTLVIEAIESASRDFETVHQDIRRLQSATDDDEREALAAVLEQRLSSLVMSLQFGDIVNQLLVFTDRQAAEVERYLQGEERLQLSDGRKPTLQTSMRSGDSELF